MSKATWMQATHRIEITIEVVAEDDEDAREIAASLCTDFITRVEVTQIDDLEEERERMLAIWAERERIDLLRPLYEREISDILADFSNP